VCVRRVRVGEGRVAEKDGEAPDVCLMHLHVDDCIPARGVVRRGPTLHNHVYSHSSRISASASIPI
jgi:hypothetical protein